MTDPFAVAADLARVIFLFRDRPEAREDQKAAFRLLVSILGSDGLVLTLGKDHLVLNNTAIPPELPGAQELQAHLSGHGIGEIRLPAGLMTSTLLSCLRTLAVPVGNYSNLTQLVAYLDEAGAGSVQVLPPPSASLSGIIHTVEPHPLPATPTSTSPPAPDQRKRDIQDGTLQALGPGAVSEAKVGMMHFVTMEMKAVHGVDELVHGLEHASLGEKTQDFLDELIIAGEIAAQKKDWLELLKAATGILQLEAKGGEMAEHRAFAIALRRMLPRSTVEPMAKLAFNAATKVEATAVLRRLGADATEALLSLLASAPTPGERRAYFNALSQMTAGSDILVRMLTHDEWFVVRNVAELCGEMKLEAAVPQLAKRITHDDERVRRAVAAALGHIGTPGTIEPLRQALRDTSPVVRMQAATVIDGRKGKGLAMTLAVALEEEQKPDVQREMLLALGRIASPDALQALMKAAEPGGKLFKRKPTAFRLAAVEGLHLAGPSASNALKNLLDDGDTEVREAAQKALATLWDG